MTQLISRASENSSFITDVRVPTMLIKRDRQSFTVKNIGKSAKRYTLRHVPAGTAITVTPVSLVIQLTMPNLIKDECFQGTIFPANGPVPLSNVSASVVITQPTFVVQPGQSQTVSVRFILPRGDPTTFPVFSGFIQVTSGSEDLHVSYIGLAASLKDKQVIDNTDVVFGVKLPVLLDSAGNVQTQPTNYTFVGEDFPALIFRYVGQVPMHIDNHVLNRILQPSIWYPNFPCGPRGREYQIHRDTEPSCGR